MYFACARLLVCTSLHVLACISSIMITDHCSSAGNCHFPVSRHETYFYYVNKLFQWKLLNAAFVLCILNGLSGLLQEDDGQLLYFFVVFFQLEGRYLFFATMSDSEGPRETCLCVVHQYIILFMTKENRYEAENYSQTSSLKCSALT